MKQPQKPALLALLLAALLLAITPAIAEDTAIIGQATYAAAEDGLASATTELLTPYLDRLLFVQSFGGTTNDLVIVPEGMLAEDFRGKGLRYTVGEVLREESDVQYRIVMAGSLEVFANSAEGTLLSLTDEEIVLDVTLGSELTEADYGEMRFAITPDTTMLSEAQPGQSVDVLYDADGNAVYVIQRNG